MDSSNAALDGFESGEIVCCSSTDAAPDNHLWVQSNDLHMEVTPPWEMRKDPSRLALLHCEENMGVISAPLLSLSCCNVEVEGVSFVEISVVASARSVEVHKLAAPRLSSYSGETLLETLKGTPIGLPGDHGDRYSVFRWKQNETGEEPFAQLSRRSTPGVVGLRFFGRFKSNEVKIYGIVVKVFANEQKKSGGIGADVAPTVVVPPPLQSGPATDVGLQGILPIILRSVTEAQEKVMSSVRNLEERVLSLEGKVRRLEEARSTNGS